MMRWRLCPLVFGTCLASSCGGNTELTAIERPLDAGCAWPAEFNRELPTLGQCKAARAVIYCKSDIVVSVCIGDPTHECDNPEPSRPLTCHNACEPGEYGT